MHTGVSQYAEHENDNRFAPKYLFVDFIDFSTFVRRRVGTCQVGFSNTSKTNMTAILQESIDQLVLMSFHVWGGEE
ncbi:hypothetical protein Y032_1080g3562 [Ancylostoma ceylanicum]|uniref:Uncharacterized protein n=1 Tax=Ancylostoma ceylanicum TaxID=53326 RepID=A0A016W641_9BILA|nr:hypothetical protein Y032_1080g3562 [Ancylostoma ceylanicum]